MRERPQAFRRDGSRRVFRRPPASRRLPRNKLGRHLAREEVEDGIDGDIVSLGCGNGTGDGVLDR